MPEKEKKPKIKKILVVGTPEWMISYGDLMSCLLVFFVLLLTFSSNQPDKLMDMMGEYVGPGGRDAALDIGDTTGSAGATKRIEVAPEDEASMRLANLVISQKYHDFKDRLYRMGFKHEIFYSQTEDGFYVEVDEHNVFGSDGEISPDAKLLLQAMVNAALSVKKELRILYLSGIGSSEDVPASVGDSAEKNAVKIYEYLNNRYRMKAVKMSCGAGFSRNSQSRVRFLIADNLEGKALNLFDLSKPKS